MLKPRDTYNRHQAQRPSVRHLALGFVLEGICRASVREGDGCRSLVVFRGLRPGSGCFRLVVMSMSVGLR